MRSEGRTLESLKIVEDDPPDIEAFEGEVRVGIELTRAGRFARQLELEIVIGQEVMEFLGDDYFRMKGWRLSLTLHNPPDASIRSKERRALSKSIAENIRSVLPDLEQRGVGIVFSREWLDDSSKSRYAISGTRLESDEYLPDLSNVTQHNTTGSHTALLHSIQEKIAKTYPRYQKLILISYDVGIITVGGTASDAVALAKDFLKSTPHPFDEVWYFIPVAEGNGHVEQIWP